MTIPADVILVVLPPVQSDTNPPLGPAILAAELEKSGLIVRTCDLGIRFLRRFDRSASVPSRMVGDQDKDRNLTHAATIHFLAHHPLRGETPESLPDCSDPYLGLHFPMTAVRRGIDRGSHPNHDWHKFLEEHFFQRFGPPAVVGISIMGPAQAMMGFVLARLVRQRWPDAKIIFGGSHITLLHGCLSASEIPGEVDSLMPGHCERKFAGRCSTIAGCRRDKRRSVPLAVVGQTACDARFSYLPALGEDLCLYDPERVTIPLQLTRGCVLRCPYCTYPVVERERPETPDWPAVMETLTTLLHRHSIHRFSFKDSLFQARNLASFAQHLLDRRLDIEWSATTLLSAELTDDLLIRLARGGCRTLEFGLESIHDKRQRWLNKRQPMDRVHRIASCGAAHGITCVFNLIYGFPHEPRYEALSQLQWCADLRKQLGERVAFSGNFLEINVGSPMAEAPRKYGIELGGNRSPWAFSYAWNSPPWRRAYREDLNLNQGNCST